MYCFNTEKLHNSDIVLHASTQPHPSFSNQQYYCWTTYYTSEHAMATVCKGLSFQLLFAKVEYIIRCMQDLDRLTALALMKSLAALLSST